MPAAEEHCIFIRVVTSLSRFFPHGLVRDLNSKCNSEPKKRKEDYRKVKFRDCLNSIN